MKRLYLLPFDHRKSFMELIKVKNQNSKRAIEKAKAYKRIIYEAFLNTLSSNKIKKEEAGILVDEKFGKEILKDAKSKGIITCLTLEKSGKSFFEFDKKYYKKLLKEIKPTYGKVLVRYNPEGNKKLNQKQAKKLAQLSKYLKKEKIKFLFELLEIPTKEELKQVGSKQAFDHKLRANLMIKAIQELQKAGVNPEIWKLEGLDKLELMHKVAQQVKAFNSQSKILILGRGEREKKAEQWLKVGAKEEAVIGFAIGRTVFQKPLEAYSDKKISKEQAINQISQNYLHFINVFEEAKNNKK